MLKINFNLKKKLNYFNIFFLKKYTESLFRNPKVILDDFSSLTYTFGIERRDGSQFCCIDHGTLNITCVCNINFI